MRSWRFQWPFRWPITWSKPPLPDVDTLRFPDYCNHGACTKMQWVYRPTKKRMGFCYKHLQQYDWIPKAEVDDALDSEYVSGSWKK